MARAPFQVIVFPFCDAPNGEPVYAIFQRRKIEVMWQAISGGGEDAETPYEAAVRETLEETGILAADRLVLLDARASIPASVFRDNGHWSDDVFVIPEYAFGVRVADRHLRLSPEHRDCAWLSFLDAHRRLTWDSNRVALWELHCRIRGLRPSRFANPGVDYRAASRGP